MTLLVVGHTNLDVQLRLDALPRPGESSPVRSRHTVYGGTACNVARHAGGLGAQVRLWSRVGDDFPAGWRKALEADGVTLAFDEAGLTPTCYVLTDREGRQSYCMDQAAMTPPYELPLGLLEGVHWLHICTGDPDSYLPLAKAATKAGIHISFDPGQEIHFAYQSANFEALLELADVFFCNDGELDKALSFLHYGSAEQLLDHVEVVIVTHGAKGATLYDGNIHKMAAVPADVVDPTGAGDALRAGWHAATQRGMDALDALRFGMATAAIAVEHQGPQSHVARWEEVEARLPPP